ncbi:hypothetical protein ONZ45_g5898 [Pleurotus djamor]|nr:hypothetical protein ONZ45_g5898 [Pleurotus djamor]
MNHSPLPNAGSSEAPRFDGDASSLVSFFEDYEVVADAAQLTMAMKISGVVRYVAAVERDTWRYTASQHNDNWDNFKTEILNLYPGAMELLKPTLQDAERLVENARAIPISSANELAAYYRKARTILLPLVDEGETGSIQASKLMLQGLPSDLRQRTEAYLTISNPTAAAKVVYKLQNVYDAAAHIIKDGNAPYFGLQDAVRTTSLSLEFTDSNSNTDLAGDCPMSRVTPITSFTYEPIIFIDDAGKFLFIAHPEVVDDSLGALEQHMKNMPQIQDHGTLVTTTLSILSDGLAIDMDLPRSELAQKQWLTITYQAKEWVSTRRRFSTYLKEFKNLESKMYVIATCKFLRTTRKLLDSPSTTAQNGALLSTQRPENFAAVYNGRPCTLTGPNIGIYHPIFSKFRRKVANQPGLVRALSAQERLCAASRLLDTSAQYFSVEAERHAALERDLEILLSSGRFTAKETTVSFGSRTFKLGGNRLANCPLVSFLLNLLWELKNGIGLGDCDPIEQATRGYMIMATSEELRKLREISCIPIFILGITGPNLTISGAIYLDGVVTERLTDYISLIPHRRFPPRSQRAVFHATLTSPTEPGRECIVKFTTRYNADAHRLMYGAGIAPELIYCQYEPDVDRRCVITEYVYHDLGKLPTVEAIEKLKAGLKLLHDNDYVFGDLRDANIIVNSDGNVFLIDFDWCDKVGKAFYPHDLNTNGVTYAAGVEGGHAITRAHDEEMLNLYVASVEEQRPRAHSAQQLA